VRLTGRNDYLVPRVGYDSSATHAKPHLAGNEGKALFLLAMDVGSGYVATGWEEEIESQHLAIRLVSALANDDSFTADCVLDYPIRGTVASTHTLQSNLATEKRAGAISRAGMTAYGRTSVDSGGPIDCDRCPGMNSKTVLADSFELVTSAIACRS
jgi:hypothetical protein